MDAAHFHGTGSVGRRRRAGRMRRRRRDEGPPREGETAGGRSRLLGRLGPPARGGGDPRREPIPAALGQGRPVLHELPELRPGGGRDILRHLQDRAWTDQPGRLVQAVDEDAWVTGRRQLSDETRPDRIAKRTSPGTSWMSRRSIRRARCVSIVLTLTSKMPAISLVERPSAIS